MGPQNIENIQDVNFWCLCEENGDDNDNRLDCKCPAYEQENISGDEPDAKKIKTTEKDVPSKASSIAAESEIAFKGKTLLVKPLTPGEMETFKSSIWCHDYQGEQFGPLAQVGESHWKTR